MKKSRGGLRQPRRENDTHLVIRRERPRRDLLGDQATTGYAAAAWADRTRGENLAAGFGSLFKNLLAKPGFSLFRSIFNRPKQGAYLTAADGGSLTMQARNERHSFVRSNSVANADQRRSLTPFLPTRLNDLAA